MVSVHRCHDGLSGYAARRCVAICSGLHSSSSLSATTFGARCPSPGAPAWGAWLAHVPGNAPDHRRSHRGHDRLGCVAAHARSSTGRVRVAERSPARCARARRAPRSAGARSGTSIGRSTRPRRCALAPGRRSPAAIETPSCVRCRARGMPPRCPCPRTVSASTRSRSPTCASVLVWPSRQSSSSKVLRRPLECTTFYF